MGVVVYVDFELRSALQSALADRRASVEAYGNALRANAPLFVLTELARWCRAADRQLHTLGA